MSRRNWKHVRATSLIEALRLCKEFAQERANLSVERIADRMGVTHDSLYKWLGTGRMPAILLPTYELACGCNLASAWIAASTGKLVIDMPKGRSTTQVDVLEMGADYAKAAQLLANFYAGNADREVTLAALAGHMQQVAWHHANVAQHATPQFDFAEAAA